MPRSLASRRGSGRPRRARPVEGRGSLRLLGEPYPFGLGSCSLRNLQQPRERPEGWGGPARRGTLLAWRSPLEMGWEEMESRPVLHDLSDASCPPATENLPWPRRITASNRPSRYVTVSRM